MANWLDIRRPRSEIWKSGAEKTNPQANGLNASLMKEILGRVILSCGPGRPEHFVCFVDNQALSDSGVSQALGVIRKEIAVYPQIQPIKTQSIINFLTEHQDIHGFENTLLFGLGAETRPSSWPLPDFARLLDVEFISRNWPEDNDLARNGPALLPLNSRLPGAKGHSIKSDAFQYGWGVVAGTVRRVGRVSLKTIELDGLDGCALFFSEGDRAVLREFVDRKVMGDKILCSVPTLASANWLFSSLGFPQEFGGKALMTEFNHGWAPSLTLLRFLTDDFAPRKMILMQELNQLALLEFA